MERKFDKKFGDVNVRLNRIETRLSKLEITLELILSKLDNRDIK